jgi:hypothetical protein
MERTVVGVDPGSSGSVAILYVDSGKVEYLDITAPPNVITDQLIHIRESTDLLGVAIEKVQAIKGCGASSTFVFGYNLGSITAILYSVVRLVFKIHPKVWQNYIGLEVSKELKGARRKKEIKNKVASICRKHYPDCAIYGKRGGLLDGRSDATMIAYTLYYKFLEN